MPMNRRKDGQVPTPHPGWHTIDLSDKPPLPQPVDAGTALLLTEQQAERDMASGAHDVASIRVGSLEAGLDVIHATVERWRKDTTKRALSARLISRTMRWAVNSGRHPEAPRPGVSLEALEAALETARGEKAAAEETERQALDACRLRGVELPGRELQSSLMALAGLSVVLITPALDGFVFYALAAGRMAHAWAPAVGFAVALLLLAHLVSDGLRSRDPADGTPARSWARWALGLGFAASLGLVVSRVLDALATSAGKQAELVVDSGAGAEAEAEAAAAAARAVEFAAYASISLWVMVGLIATALFIGMSWTLGTTSAPERLRYVAAVRAHERAKRAVKEALDHVALVRLRLQLVDEDRDATAELFEYEADHVLPALGQELEEHYLEAMVNLAGTPECTDAAEGWATERAAQLEDQAGAA